MPDQHHDPVPHGYIEPHAGLLVAPAPEQQLFKMMRVENLLRSIDEGYLHFNRVDSYSDFPGADANDGAQLPQDLPANADARFEKAPHFSAADYYNRSRSRTYACCFSLENSEHIWREYANGDVHGKVCVAFNFGRLRARLNSTLDPAQSKLSVNGVTCTQFFSLNYGIVDYVDWDTHKANGAHLPNPIQYTYLKDSHYGPEKELRISLSVVGLGRIVMAGQEFDFPASFQVPFDFRAATADGAIERFEVAPGMTSAYLEGELAKRGAVLQR